MSKDDLIRSSEDLEPLLKKTPSEELSVIKDLQETSGSPFSIGVEKGHVLDK